MSIRERFRSLGILPLFVVAHLAHHLLTALPTPLSPFIRDEFGLDYAQTGLVISAFGIAYGLGQIPFGLLADRIGPRKVITIGICGVALVGALVWFSQSFVMTIVLIALMGVTGGGYHPAAAPLITESVPEEQQGRALGIHLIGGSGSNFISPLVAAGIAAVWGWRGSFLGLAVPTMILGIIFYRVLGNRSYKRTVQEVTEGQTEAVAAPARSAINWRQLIAFMGLSLSVQGIITAVQAFIPLFLVDHFGVSESVAAVFLSLIFLAGLWSSTLGGWLSDKFGTIPVTLIACLLSAPVIFLLPRVAFGPGGTIIGALLLFAGMLMFIRMPVAEAFIMSRTREGNRSTILGIYYFMNMEMGAVLAPVMGGIIDRFGFEASYTGAATLVLGITLLASLFLTGSRR